MCWCFGISYLIDYVNSFCQFEIIDRPCEYLTTCNSIQCNYLKYDTQTSIYIHLIISAFERAICEYLFNYIFGKQVLDVEFEKLYTIDCVYLITRFKSGIEELKKEFTNLPNFKNGFRIDYWDSGIDENNFRIVTLFLAYY